MSGDSGSDIVSISAGSMSAGSRAASSPHFGTTTQAEAQAETTPAVNPAVLPTSGAPTLILLRHGRTVLNNQDRLQGTTDVDLDFHGQSQSRKVGKFIRAFYNVDQVISSPLKRTRQTIHYAGFDELPLLEDRRFAEIDYGEWEGDAIALRASDMIDRWNMDVNFAPPGGESIASLFERVSAACEELMHADQKSNVLVCSHATPIKAAVVWALGGDAKMIMHIHSRPASITVIAQTPFGRVLVGYNERPQSENAFH